MRLVKVTTLNPIEATPDGGFTGTMDDITDGTTYVKTHNDFTDAEQTKLGGIEAGAEVNVNADWNAVSGDAVINNKPTIPTLPSVASGAEVDTGTDNTKMVTPKAMEDSSYTKLALGETSTTAYRGDRGKTAYDHSQATHAPSTADNTFTAINESTALDKSTVNGSDKIGVAVTETMANIAFDDLKAYLKDYFDTLYTPL